MAVIGDLLFYSGRRADLSDVLRHHTEQLGTKVNAMPDADFRHLTDDEIASRITTQESLTPLEIDLLAAKVSVSEAQVEVTDRFSYDIRPGQTLKVPGVLASKSIPFTGDAALWHLTPSTYSMNPPRGEVRGNTVVIGISVPSQRADEAASYIEQTIAQLHSPIETQRAQIAAFNDALDRNIRPHIAARRARLSTADDLLKKLEGR